MKNIPVLLVFILFSTLTASANNTPPYTVGVRLNVFASSGLKLRAFPSRNAEVLDIVRYGDVVEIGRAHVEMPKYWT